MHPCAARIRILVAYSLLRDIERGRTDANVFSRMVDGRGGSLGSEQKWWMLVGNVVDDSEVKDAAPTMYGELVTMVVGLKERIA